MAQRSAYIGEVRQYDDPKNPTTSAYDVILPATTASAVIVPGDGQSVDAHLTAITAKMDNAIPKNNIAAATGGTLPVARGGTGGTTPQEALTKLFTTYKTTTPFVLGVDNGFANPGSISVEDLRIAMGALKSTDSAGGMAHRALTPDIRNWIPYGSSGMWIGEGAAVANAPDSGWWRYIGISHANAGGYICLIALPHAQGGQKIHYQYCVNGAWQGWKRLFDSGDIIPVANGGTGAGTAAAARTNLGLASEQHRHDAGDITSGVLSAGRGGSKIKSIQHGSVIVSYTPTSSGNVEVIMNPVTNITACLVSVMCPAIHEDLTVAISATNSSRLIIRPIKGKNFSTNGSAYAYWLVVEWY